MFRSYILTATLILGSFTAIASIIPTQPEQATAGGSETTITVHVTGIHSAKGQIILQIWNTQDGFPTKAAKGLKATSVAAGNAVAGAVDATFNVVPGTYAVTIWHDENSNGKFDTNVLGIPKEGYGTSNNPVTHFHAPSFDQAKFQVPVSGQKISISMHY